MGVRALIADGSELVRNAIRQQLECIGCDIVAEAETAAQALPLFRTVRPEIVTLGMDLPYGGQTSPIALVRLIKREAPDTSVVMLGRMGAAVATRAFVRAGALDCIHQPFNSGSLETLWRHLSRIYPELRVSRFGAIISAPNHRQSRGLRL